MRKLLIVAAVVALAAAHVPAGVLPGLVTKKGTAFAVALENMTPASQKLGLTKAYVKTQVELRMRRNGLKVTSELAVPAIAISIQVFQTSGGFLVGLYRRVTYDVDGLAYATDGLTWSTTGGFTNSTREQIMQIVLEAVDYLCNEILKAQVE